ncbi:MAG: diaminopropionate ammonia-lyase [Chloroflexi bacterium]|nr:MAG: diaminopropionate ammonia-lyase [Chloroflexota bacterium]
MGGEDERFIDDKVSQVVTTREHVGMQGDGPGARLVTNRARDLGYAGARNMGLEPIAFHRTMPAYVPTPVIELPQLAERSRVGVISVKNEQDRLGLPSFKVLGSSWALHQRVKRVAGLPADALIPFAMLRARIAELGRPTLCTASDGNHGRAIAALAEALGCGCVVFLPGDSAASRLDAIKSHGASVELVDGSYDEAVARARVASGARNHWYCPDTVGPDATGEERLFASDVMSGYATLFEELFDQVERLPDLVFVQAGVGGLSAAAVSAVRRVSATAKVVIVEPQGSNAIALSFAAGAPVAVPDVPTIMACLRCQSVSGVAWPVLEAGVDGAMTVTDEEAAAAVRALAQAGVESGASGAAGLAGAMVTCASEALRAGLGISPNARVAVVNTEGATDPASTAAILTG